MSMLLAPPDGPRLSTISAAISLTPSVLSSANGDEPSTTGKKSHKSTKDTLVVVITILLPVLSVSALAGVSLTKAYMQRSEILDLQSKVFDNEKMRTLVMRLQEERSTSCLFTGSDPESDLETFDRLKDNLVLVTEATDSVLGQITNTDDWVRVDPDDQHLKWTAHPHYTDTKDFQNNLNQYRYHVSKFMPSCYNITEEYHYMIQFFVAQILEEFLVSQNGEIRSAVLGYINWIQAKEFVAMRKSMGSGIFASGGADVDSYAYYQQIVGSAEILLELTQVALPDAQTRYNKETDSQTEAMANVTHLDELLKRNQLEEGSQDRAARYVDSMSDFVRVLSEVEIGIAETLNFHLQNQADALLWELSYVLVATIFCILFCPAVAAYHAIKGNRMNAKLFKRSRQLLEDEKQIGRLLTASFPNEIAARVRTGQAVYAETYRSVTVCCFEVVGFSLLVTKGTAMQTVELLNALHRKLEQVVSRHDCCVVTLDGSYMTLVSGLPKRNEPQHSGEIADVAMDLLKNIRQFEIPHRGSDRLIVRLGIDTDGPCVAGVIGSRTLKYCIFGCMLDQANRMMTSGKGMRVQLSKATHEHLDLSFRSQYGMIMREYDTGEEDINEESYWLVNKFSDLSLGIEPAAADLLLNDAKYLKYKHKK